MFIRLNLLLLCCFVCHSGSDPKSVSGIKGGKVILPCDFEDKKMHIDLSSQTENIDVCDTEDCSGRVFKGGSCDVIIKDLSFSDAGTYFLRVYFTNDQNGLKPPQTRMYQLHIQDEISVNTGEELKMDVLFSNAYKVETNSSGEWTEVWTRSQGVRSDRLTVSDGNLTINAFTSTDTGTYRVLDYEGETLITVTVTGSGAESKDELNDIREDKTDHTDDKNNDDQKNWIVPLPVSVSVSVSSVVLLVLLVLIIFYKCRHRNREHTSESKSKSNCSEIRPLNQNE